MMTSLSARGSVFGVLGASAAMVAATAIFAADPFGGTMPGAEIGAALPAGYEPSGAVWHPRLQKLFVVSDGGIVSRMDLDGSGVVNWSVPGDLEGITVADPSGNLLYLGIEQPDGISEFDMATGQVRRTFDLTPWMQGPDNSGLEALTFVPEAANPEGGLFYAGLQNDGVIYVFELPIRTSATSTVVRFVRTINPVPGRADISGLEWDRDDGVLYAIWDGADMVRKMTADGTFIAEWTLPGNDQEGIAISPCAMTLAEDVGKEVWRYDFPTTTADADGDGVANCGDACPGTAAGAPVDALGCPLAACSGNARCDDGVVCSADACVAQVCVHTGSDADHDGVFDCVDDCRAVANASQADFDADGMGDACETGAWLADADRSGRVDGHDLVWLARSFSMGCAEPGYAADVDLDRDCVVDGTDLVLMAAHFGGSTVP